MDHFMDEHCHSDLLYSSRDLSSFCLKIHTAKSKVEIAKILHGYNLSEEAFTDGFPDLAKTVQDLPDDASITS
ncbi:hypothetical protein [Streptomyces justiciae]|uniref:Uncharacterized protein n=1 Tax=Streptomyces justiciae TaxID=2780140 RepID=A0ABU3LWG7_9ACTN|nr:hypothetical protein [Streptomyces justiciae]MDT7842917.1 hypothetical protein [Streptomyces justiciae]